MPPAAVMSKWWMKCVCCESAETRLPGSLRGDDLPRSVADTSCKEVALPIQVDDVTQLQELLREIDKAIDGARRPTTRREQVTKTLATSVDGAETILNYFARSCEAFRNPRMSRSIKIADESYNLLTDLLRGAGNLHWAAAGLSMMAFVLDRMNAVETNSEECLTLLEAMRDLGKHVVALYPELKEQDEKLRRATCLITEGAILCCDHMKSGIANRFAFASANADDFLIIRRQISMLYPDLCLTANEAILSRTTVLLRQSSMPLSPHKPEFPVSKVGLIEKVDAVIQLLGMEDLPSLGSGVRAVVLHGMGGIGKSTLGTALHAMLPFEDREHAKVEVGERPTNEKIRDCQKDLLVMLSGQKLAMGDCAEGRQKLGSYFQHCRSPKFLFIDNIFDGKDLDKLLPDSLFLPDGSRIIITSRDASVCAILEEKGVDCRPYRLAELEPAEAKQLLCMQVFHHLPPPPHREDSISDLLNICGGNPLALEVVGRYLRRHNTDRAWKFAIDSLRTCRPLSGKKEDQLYHSLMFSYNQLAKDYQDAFLDITCLLHDTPWDWVEPIYGEKLVTLEELALVKKISDADGFVRLQVHDLVVALGRSMQLGTRISSDGKDELPILLQYDDTGGCEAVEGLFVRSSKEHLHAEKLDAMHRSLRVLILQDVLVLGKCSKIPHHLQLCIITDGMPFPWHHLAKLQQLQVLIMSHEIDFDLKSIKFPRDLKVLILIELGTLTCLPTDFGELSNLQTLEISSCESMQYLPESFCRLQCLHTLSFSDCRSLKKLPTRFGHLHSLQTLDLRYCSQLQELPEIGQLAGLRRLDLCGCNSLRSLPESLSQLQSLEFLHLGECGSLEALPTKFGSLFLLQNLNLTRCTSLERLPEGFEMLRALRALSLEHCHKLSTLPVNFGRLALLESLRLSDCPSLKEVPASFLELRRLNFLDVSGCHLANMSLIEELKQQQDCRVWSEPINVDDMDYPESTEHDSALSPYYTSTELDDDRFLDRNGGTDT